LSAEQPYRVIAVRNECGDELVVYEYWLTRTFFGMVAGRRLKLSSGEEVVPVDDGSFMVAKRGGDLHLLPGAPHRRANVRFESKTDTSPSLQISRSGRLVLTPCFRKGAAASPTLYEADHWRLAAPAYPPLPDWKS
jgi:hypothetical protein